MYHSDFAPAVLPASELEQLEVSLQAQLSGRVSDLRLQFDDGAIIMLGRARTFHAKQLAQHALMRLTNLPILANDIEVC